MYVRYVYYMERECLGFSIQNGAYEGSQRTPIIPAIRYLVAGAIIPGQKLHSAVQKIPAYLTACLD